MSTLNGCTPPLSRTNLLLPGYGDRAGAEFPVEVNILRLNFDTPNCGELFNIEDIFRVNCVRLKSVEKKGRRKRSPSGS